MAHRSIDARNRVGTNGGRQKPLPLKIVNLAATNSSAQQGTFHQTASAQSHVQCGSATPPPATTESSISVGPQAGASPPTTAASLPTADGSSAADATTVAPPPISGGPWRSTWLLALQASWLHAKHCREEYDKRYGGGANIVKAPQHGSPGMHRQAKIGSPGSLRHAGSSSSSSVSPSRKQQDKAGIAIAASFGGDGSLPLDFNANQGRHVHVQRNNHKDLASLTVAGKAPANSTSLMPPPSSSSTAKPMPSLAVLGGGGGSASMARPLVNRQLLPSANKAPPTDMSPQTPEKKRPHQHHDRTTPNPCAKSAPDLAGALAQQHSPGGASAASSPQLLKERTTKENNDAESENDDGGAFRGIALKHRPRRPGPFAIPPMTWTLLLSLSPPWSTDTSQSAVFTLFDTDASMTEPAFCGSRLAESHHAGGYDVLARFAGWCQTIVANTKLIAQLTTSAARERLSNRGRSVAADGIQEVLFFEPDEILAADILALCRVCPLLYCLDLRQISRFNDASMLRLRHQTISALGVRMTQNLTFSGLHGLGKRLPSLVTLSLICSYADGLPVLEHLEAPDLKTLCIVESNLFQPGCLMAKLDQFHPNLTRLELSGVYVERGGIRMLKSATLKELELMYCDTETKMDDEAKKKAMVFEDFAEKFPNLDYLMLHDSDGVSESTVKSAVSKTVTQLVVNACHTGPSCLEDLEARLPHLEYLCWGSRADQSDYDISLMAHAKVATLKLSFNTVPAHLKDVGVRFGALTTLAIDGDALDPVEGLVDGTALTDSALHLIESRTISTLELENMSQVQGAFFAGIYKRLPELRFVLLANCKKIGRLGVICAAMNRVPTINFRGVGFAKDSSAHALFSWAQRFASSYVDGELPPVRVALSSHCPSDIKDPALLEPLLRESPWLPFGLVNEPLHEEKFYMPRSESSCSSSNSSEDTSSSSDDANDDA